MLSYNTVLFQTALMTQRLFGEIIKRSQKLSALVESVRCYIKERDMKIILIGED